ncbi:phage infection protein [Ancylobacter sp. A5.8]|uniref:phage infection protein n=1 Tax=Ancylobacter gelatini TaxID=2919920 RepID=UPI001F4D44B6|nr:phage infection protein [Ancylobacter gelatini]
MDKLNIDLSYCYGIRKLKQEFDYTDTNAIALYAPNGAMKSSLAKTFRDLAAGKQSGDRIFPGRKSHRSITDQNSDSVAADSILVIEPYDEVFSHSEKTSTLLVNATLRKEYEQLHEAIGVAKDFFLKSVKAQSSSKKDVEKEISLAFGSSDNQLFKALLRIKGEIAAEDESPLANVKYDTLFDEKVIQFLGTKDFKTAIEDYIRKYNELLGASTYFKKGTFNYYNASTIAKSLADNGFFKASHTIRLNADTIVEITDEKQLADIIAKEKEAISSDADLRKKYGEIEKLITKNASVRDFEQYLSDNEDILPRLANTDQLKEDLWKAYIKANEASYNDLIEKYEAAEKRKTEIEEQAAKERTQWEEVIDIFNDRFFVPFKLTAKNRVSVILGQEPILTLGFTFEDGGDSAQVERASLIEILSTGEKKALYVLNIIFEIEARLKAGQTTILIVDDIADSFDYKNKYAIIEYLKDIADGGLFKQLILTHNFDFYRTICSRFVGYPNCYMASKSAGVIQLGKATGIQNVFVNDWKRAFFTDANKRIASIPFIRNLIEFTKGITDPDYVKLTSLLHWKADSASITEADLDAIYSRVFGGAGTWGQPAARVIDTVHSQAAVCLGAATAANLEHKIVLSIASRLKCEAYMVSKVANPAATNSISANQTPKLLKLYQASGASSPATVKTVQRVLLMTPENIHLNSFMYEPILDMADDHLRKLYQDVLMLVP